MIVKYQITVEDLVAFNRYHCKHSSAVRKSKFNRLLLIWILLISVSLILPPKDGLTRPVIVGSAICFGVLLTFACYIGWAAAMDRQARRLYKEGKNKGTVGQHELEIDEGGLVARTEVSEIRRSWQGIERILETDEHVFFYVSSVAAHVIPKHSVTFGYADSFVAKAKQWWLAANPDAEATQKD